MAFQRTEWDYLNDMFGTMASQGTQRAQAATGALSSGLTYYQKKDYTRASSEFKRAISLDPTSTQSYNYLANSFLAQKKYDEAIKTLKGSLSLDPTQASVHQNLGNVYLQQKKFSLAEKEFKEAGRLDPTDTVAPYTLGQLYVQTERYAEAETQFKKVSKMAPNDPNPYYSLGATYIKQEKWGEAVKQLTQAVKLRPKMTAAQFELGVAYSELGDVTKAQKQVDIVKRLDAAQGALLQATIAQPKLVAVGGGDVDNFTNALGMNTPLFALAPELLPPNTSKEFNMSFYFDSKMDTESVQDIANWTITKASGGAAGYYNNLLAVLPTDAYIPQNPTRVVYDPDKQMATVTFLLSQNAAGNATVDPSHMVFKFSGTDARGKIMDPTADEFDGAAQVPF